MTSLSAKRSRILSLLFCRWFSSVPLLKIQMSVIEVNKLHLLKKVARDQINLLGIGTVLLTLRRKDKFERYEIKLKIRAVSLRLEMK